MSEKFTTARECTVTKNNCLKIRTCLFVLCSGLALGFLLSELSYTSRHPKVGKQVDDIHQYVYLFDTEQKIADYYRAIETSWTLPECLFARQGMARRGRDRPLVTVEPFTIFINNDSGEVSVHESQSPMYLVRLRKIEQLKFLRLNALLEKGRELPRFGAVVTYSKDGVYKRSGVSLSDDNSKLTSFDDSKGIGIFDTMEVWENGKKSIYSLNGLTWERSDEPPLYLPPPPPPMELPSMNTQ